MSKTGSIILKSVLGLLIVFLAVMIFLCVNRPQQRESEFFTRRDACGEKLKVIRTLEEAHKAAYGTYCGDFDTLLINLNKQEQKVMRKEKAENAPDSVYDMPELEAIRKGWIVQKEVLVVPLEKLREDGKLTLTDEQLADVIYVPYTHKQTKFTLKADSVAASLSGAGDKLPTFEAYVTLDELFADYKGGDNGGALHKFVEIFTGSDAQWLINKKADLKDKNKFQGWKVGDITAPVVEGNFE
ncbi:MAG: hypothetical protein K5842_01380 [Bacteroidales bacterium]|nr:hypothetical protein [Bacteroidales bacterium]